MVLIRFFAHLFSNRPWTSIFDEWLDSVILKFFCFFLFFTLAFQGSLVQLTASYLYWQSFLPLASNIPLTSKCKYCPETTVYRFTYHFFLVHCRIPNLGFYFCFTTQTLPLLSIVQAQRFLTSVFERGPIHSSMIWS